MAAVTAIVAGAAVAASVAGGVAQAGAQKKAASDQRASVRDTNELNYQQFRESRGAGGNAILPMYMQAGTEERLGNEAVEVYDAITGQPVAMTLAEYENIVRSAQPVIDQGDEVIRSIFSGALEDQRLASLSPVLAARIQAANTNSEAINVALAEEQNRISAVDAAKGYSGGGGSFVANRLLQAAIQGRQQAAGGVSAAKLANTQDTRAVNDAAVDLKLRSIDAPINRVNQLIQMKQAPATGVANLNRIAQQPLDFFRLGAANPPRNETPQYTATPSTGGVILSGLGQAAGAAGSYMANKDLANAIRESGYGSANYSSLSPAQQDAYINALQSSYDPNLA